MRDFERERRQADLFYADLMGTRQPGRGRAPKAAEAVGAQAIEAEWHEAVDEHANVVIEPTPISPSRVFDEVVHRGANPADLLIESDESVTWEAIALPYSSTPAEQLEDGSVVVTRALGEDRLAAFRVLGKTVHRHELYGPGGRIREDTLVLARRSPETLAGEAEAPDDGGQERDQEQDEHAGHDEQDLSFLRWSPATRAGYFPPRDPAAAGGRAFMETIKGEGAPENWERRENAIVAELAAGNMPTALLRWITINLTHTARGRTMTGSVQVLPDYLAVGSDTDFVHVPLDPVSAQLIADRFDTMLPTARICHAIYQQTAAKNRLNAITRDYFEPDSRRRSARRGRAQTSTAAYLEHSEAIQAKMRAAAIPLGELVAGHKKDVVIASRLHQQPQRIAFQGFYDDNGYPREPCYENPQGRPQPSCQKDTPTLAHNRRFSDYSQGVRLVHPSMIVNGERKLVSDVLADPELSYLISSEGPIAPPRIPKTARPRPMESYEQVEQFEDSEQFENREPFAVAEQFEDSEQFDDSEQFEDSEPFEDSERFEAFEQADPIAQVAQVEDMAAPASVEDEQVPGPAAAAGSAPASAVSIAAAGGLGTSRTVAPIATVSPQRQMNELLDRELILFAQARILAEWVDRNLSAPFERAAADAALMSRLDVSRDRVLLDKLRPFPQGRIPERRGQLFTTDAVMQDLLRPPANAAALRPIFDVLHHYGVILLPHRPGDAAPPASAIASITRVDARLERGRFDSATAAIEQHAVKFKKSIGSKSVLHHCVEAEAIPAAWAAGRAGPTLYVAKPVVALLRRLRELNQHWRAGTYAGHWWNDFSVDIFLAAAINAERFWARDSVRAFLRALNTACEQDTPPGRFAWKAIYNDEQLAQEMNGLYGAGRLLFGVDGHGPGPRMHIHLDVRPLTVPLDATTGFRVDRARVVLSPPPSQTTASPATTRPSLPQTAPAASTPAAPPPTAATSTTQTRTPPPPATPATPARSTREDEAVGEAVPLSGRGRFHYAPLGGAADEHNVEARWNVDAASTENTVDVVVYLHGYGAPGTEFLARKAATAGLDMLDGTGAPRVRAARPTLALVPRGRHEGDIRWVFDTLDTAAELDAFVQAGLAWLCTTALRRPGGSTLTRGRLTLIAHSGGGAAMNKLIASGVNPDEVICFDSLYGDETPIRRWAETRIASQQAAQSGLRVFYTPCAAASGSWKYWTDQRWHLVSTEVAARRLQHALERALSAVASAMLASRYRVEKTTVGHSEIPARYSRLLLNDIAANVPNASPPPPASSRPLCVANDDWLTEPPRKPGGDEPPAPRAASAISDPR